MRIALLAFCFLVLGCSHAQECPDVTEQLVSVCRAEASCGKGSAGNIFGAFLGGMGAGLSHSRNQAADNYNDCVDRNLASQKANAGIPDHRVNCKTIQVSSDEYTTTCN